MSNSFHYRSTVLRCFTCHKDVDLLYLNGGYWALPSMWVVLDAVLEGARPAAFCSDECVREGIERIERSRAPTEEIDDPTPVERPPHKRP